MLSYHEADPEGQAGFALFRKTLQEAGWIDGRNAQIMVRWFPPPAVVDKEAGEIVGLSPDVVFANSSRLLITLTKATHTIPVVFNSVSDPLEQGIVTSLARPGGNVTGFSHPPFSVAGKAVQMIKEVAPHVTRIALVTNASNGAAPGYSKVLDLIAASLTIMPVQATFHTPRDLESTIEAFAREPNGALFVPRDTFSEENRDLIVALAARHRMPALYAHRTFIEAGGLMSYGADPIETFHSAATYVDRILRGEKPGDLPVQEPAKFELVISLKTARALGLHVPLPLLAAADEVIE